MTVAIYLSTLGNGGSERQAFLLANYLVGAGCDVLIVTINGQVDFYGFQKIARVVTLDKGWGRACRRLAICFHCLSAIFKSRNNIFFTESFQPYLRVLDVGATLRKRSVFSLRKSLDKLSASIGELREFRQIHTQMKAPDSRLQEWDISPVVIRNFCTPIVTLPSGDVGGKWLIIGRHDRDKGVLELVEFLIKNREQLSRSAFEIWGRGPETDAIRERLRGVPSSFIDYRGVYTDVDAVMASAQGLLTNSYSEGFPNAVDEAINRGLPVVFRGTELGAQALAKGVPNARAFYSLHELRVVLVADLVRIPHKTRDEIDALNRDIFAQWKILLQSLKK